MDVKIPFPLRPKLCLTIPKINKKYVHKRKLKNFRRTPSI